MYTIENKLNMLGVSFGTPYYIYIKKGECLDILNSIVALLTVASCLSAVFNYVVIRPLQHAIDLNSDVLHELKREIERSVACIRALDVTLM